MPRPCFAALAAVAAALVLAVGAGAQPAPGFTELDSVSSAGVQGNQDSELPAVSADGRYVAFASLSDNLVPGDTNGAVDVFVRDRLTGTTERVSVSSTGAQGNANSGLLNGMGGPSITADGRYVAFDSQASNLVKSDTNNAIDVFVRDRVTGTTERDSVSSAGVQGNGDSTHPSINADGSRVAFDSFADTLVQPDTNFSQDVFVHDRGTGSTVRASDAPGGVQGNNFSFGADVNGNGHLVVFSTFASNLGGNPDATVQVMLRDLDSGALIPISSQGADFLERSSDARITPDGRFIVWDESSSNLLPRAIVRLDRTTNTREIESVNDAGQAGNDDSSLPDLSSDGRFVALTSMASNLVPEDTNGRLDVFVRDTVAHTTRRVSVGSNGEQGDLDSLAPAVDSDGAVIAFYSDASTLVPESGQSFFANDIFVRDARPAADLVLTLADSPDPVALRGTLTYAATISNGGPTAVTGLTLVGDLSPDSAFLSATGATCSRVGKAKTDGTITCSVGNLAAGASTTVRILVQPAHTGTLTFAPKVYADQPDPNRANNTASVTTTVTR
jgi:Tol biopolymer transport system component